MLSRWYGGGTCGSACLHAGQGWEVVAVEMASTRSGLRNGVCRRLEGGGQPVCEVEEQKAIQALIWKSMRQHCSQVHWWNSAEHSCLPSS